MIINSASLDAIRVGFNAAYKRGLGQAQTQYGRVATTERSTTAENRYGWLGKMPNMREWIGPRAIQGISEHDYSVKNRDYLKDRYVLPLAETPPLIADLAQVIAIYKLHVYAPDPKIKDDYTDAMRTLREIAGGVVRLSVAGVEVTGTGGSGARITDRQRPMTEANLKGFI